MKSSSRRLKTLLVRGTAAVVVLAAAFSAATALRQHRTFSAPTPDVRASADPAVIERGRALIYGAAHCADCHSDPASKTPDAIDTPLSGGREFHLPVGVFRVPNITPDLVTGIGRRADRDVAKILRHSVRPDGSAVLPFMPFSDLTDEDLTAIVSYLGQAAPVRHEVAPHELNLAGKLVKAWVLAPKGPTAPPPPSIERAATVEYGRYIAHSVANCVGCHTKIDLRTGALAAPIFSGGAVHPSFSDPTKKFIAPNLTPHPTSGWITNWSEDVFAARFKSGRVHDGSPMPWPAFERMSDIEVRAVYRYLRTVPTAPGGPDPERRGSVVMTASK